MSTSFHKPGSHSQPDSPDLDPRNPNAGLATSQPATPHSAHPPEPPPARANVINFPPPPASSAPESSADNSPQLQAAISDHTTSPPPSTNPAPAPAQPRTRADIARENGAKSKGPITPEGKRRSSMNAITHGFTAKHCGFSNQIASAVDKYHRQFSREYRPQTPTEMAFVDTMALCKWQQQSAAEEIAAFVDHNRETYFNDPAHSQPLRNMLAIDKITSEHPCYQNHQRHLRDAERRMGRAMRDFIFLRRNSHLLELDVATRPNLDDTRMTVIHQDDIEPFEELTVPATTLATGPTTGPDSGIIGVASHNPPETIGADSAAAPQPIARAQNEPIQTVENTHPPANYEAASSSLYPENKPNKPAANAPKKYQGINLEEWNILKIINKSLLKYPEAFREVADSLCDYERKQIALNS